jgi:hypothetical protein
MRSRPPEPRPALRFSLLRRPRGVLPRYGRPLPTVGRAVMTAAIWRPKTAQHPEIPWVTAQNQPLVIESRVFHKFLWSRRRLVLPAGNSPTTVFCVHMVGGPTIWSGVRRRSSTCARYGQMDIPPPKSVAAWASRKMPWWARRTGSICRRAPHQSAGTVQARANHGGVCRGPRGRRCRLWQAPNMRRCWRTPSPRRGPGQYRRRHACRLHRRRARMVAWSPAAGRSASPAHANFTSATLNPSPGSRIARTTPSSPT